jgi:polyisoprenyl-phosphate glycosyltransferase
MNMEISVIIPLYRCEQYIDELNQRLCHTLDLLSLRYELLYIDDGSPESDWDAVRKLGSTNPAVKGIGLSRNFGQHYAITAGLEVATGEWVVVMDGDLQDQPEEIPRLYELARSGYDMVCAQRMLRKDSAIKRAGSRVFYRVFSYLTGIRQDPTVANFGIYHRKVVEAVLNMGDVIRYFPAMVQWVGFRSAKLAVSHAPRLNGRSSYSIRQLSNLAFNNMIAFSEKPLWLTVRAGFILSVAAAIVGLVYLGLYLTDRIMVTGYASLIISLWFLSGVIIFILGIVGLYIGKIFQRVKDRPLYIVNEKINL